MSLLTRNELILAKTETTYNTDSVPTAALNAVQVANPSWATEGLRMNERNTIHGTIGTRQHIYGGNLKTVSFDIELKGSGAAGTAPEFGPLIEACGFAETVVASTSVTYDPTSPTAASPHDSITIYYFQDGLRHVITGCRGTMTGVIETGNMAMLSFTFTGHSGAPTDVALPTPTLDATEPVAVRNASFTVDGYAACVNNLSFDVGSSLILPSCMNDADGYGEVSINGRDVMGTFDPEMTLVATQDFYGKFVAGTKMALTTGVLGTTAGNQVQLDMAQTYYRDIAPGDKDGIRTYEIPYGAVETTGDDEMSLIFT